jgi:carboxyl-terminal processing protease
MKSSSRILSASILLALFGAGCAMQAKQSRAFNDVVTDSPREAALTPVLQTEGGKPKGKVASDIDNAVTAKVVAQILSQSHYLQQPLNDQMASKLLDRYLDSLDPLHLYFLQSDITGFDKVRATLADKVMESGDTGAAKKVFDRFIERFDAQTAYVNELLKSETFAFEGNETFSLDRKNAPRPKDLDEAKGLWRERLRYEYLQEKLNKQKPEEIVKTLTRRYARVSRALHEYDSDDIFELYLNALAHVYDPHSDYMGRATSDNFDIQMRLSLVGIGALLQSEDGYCKVAEIIPGGPAEKSKQLKVGDKIIAVAQDDAEPVDVVDMKIDNVVALIRGKKDTTVRLTIIPADAPDPSTRKILSLVRQEIKLEEQAAKAKLIETPAEGGKALRLGVIDLPSFYEDMSARSKGEHTSTTADVAKLLTKLKAEKVDGVVLDLRRNGGGSLEEAIRLTGLFIKQGPVVQVRDSDGTIRVDKDPDPTVLYDGPLIVLTSKGSASASEILAGALQDYDRALIVGDNTTFGKGTVQAVVQLAPIMRRYKDLKLETDPGALKLTIQKFYRPGGSSTQLKGVAADINIPAVNDYTDIGEKSLDSPLPWDTVPPAKFDKLNRAQPYLAELKKRSQARAATDKDLAYRREIIERFKKAQAQKSVSLNEKSRLLEKTELEARVKARKQELAARPPSKEKVFELTLKQVGLPGLPAPVNPKAGKTAQNTKPKPGEEATEPDALDADTPEIDITLEETKRILSDLIALSEKPKPVAKK